MCISQLEEQAAQCVNLTLVSESSLDEPRTMCRLLSGCNFCFATRHMASFVESQVVSRFLVYVHVNLIAGSRMKVGRQKQTHS